MAHNTLENMEQNLVNLATAAPEGLEAGGRLA